jgi:WD40 repeat protein
MNRVSRLAYLCAVMAIAVVVPAVLAADPKPLTLIDEQTVKHLGTITGVAFTPDGKKLATSAGDLAFWDLTGQEPKKLTAAKATRLRSLAFSPDGKMLAAGSWGNTATLLDRSDDELKERAVVKGHDFGAGCVAFHPEGKVLATGGDDGGVFIWDITGDKPKEISAIKAGGAGVGVGVGSIAYTPDGKTLMVATWGGATLTFYDMTGKAPKQTSQVKEKDNLALAVSPDGKMLARAANDKTVHIYTLEAKPKRKKVLESHTEQATALAFSADGRTLASCGQDGKLIVWDVESGKQRFSKQRPQQFECLALSSSGDAPDQFTVAAGNANTVFLYRIGPAK